VTLAIGKDKLIHASLAYGVALLAMGSVTVVILALADLAVERMTALRNAAEQASAIKTRLDENREETRKILLRLGAGPADLPILSNPETAKGLAASACDIIAKKFNGACNSMETPLSETMSRHEARLSATGDPVELYNFLAQSVLPPLRVHSFSLRHVPSQENVDLTATIAAIGARTPSEAP